MKIYLAKTNETEDIINFFEKKLDKTEIINEEFLCPFGIKGAIFRKQILIAKESENIIGAVRFYPQKTIKIVSIYQFVFLKDIKLIEVLKHTGYNKFQTKCFKNGKISNYLKKQNWKLLKTDDYYDFYNFNF